MAARAAKNVLLFMIRTSLQLRDQDPELDSGVGAFSIRTPRKASTTEISGLRKLKNVNGA
jgi:hypothetical protein